MLFIGCIQNSLPLFDNLFRASIMDIFGSQEPDAGMVMFLVIPVEKVLTKCPGIFNGSKPLRKRRPVFQGFDFE